MSGRNKAVDGIEDERQKWQDVQRSCREQERENKKQH